MALKTKEQLKAGFVSNLNEYNNATIGGEKNSAEKKETPAPKKNETPAKKAVTNSSKPKAAVTATTEAKVEAVKNKVGRPKGEEVKHISVAVPVRMLDQMNKATLTHRGNATAYIISLIEQDLKKNGNRYEEAAKLLGH